MQARQVQILSVAGLAVGLGTDAMSVSAAVGVRWHGPRRSFRLAWHMGLFQFFMPILGWLAGRQLAGALCTLGTYLAAGMVFAIGLKMLIEAIRAKGALTDEAEEAIEEHITHHRRDPTRDWSLVMLSLATNIDALVAGFSLGLRGEQIYAASIIIGVVAASMSLIGITLGRHLGKVFGRTAEVFGALVLMGLAVTFLVV
ncbi:MAG: manganese efflux pump MntP family protein [Phycisphaerae bacterium]